MDWRCPQCTLINPSSTRRCNACGHGQGYDPVMQEGIGAVSRQHHSQNLGFEAFDYSGRHFLQEELRIVMIGRTGSGKSATGNSILGGHYFESLVCGSSVTRKCKRGRATRMGRQLQVIDSPGLFDTGMSQVQITKEIVKCIGMTSPGPHAIILVTRIDRFTKEEQDTVQHFRDIFGEGMMRYLLVLFTRKDDLDRDNVGIGQYITRVPTELQQLLNECNQRYIAFNNRAERHEIEQQVQQLITMINSMVAHNDGQCYTNEMYSEAERAVRQREQEMVRKMQEQKRKEREQMEKEFEKKMNYQSRQQQDIIDQLQGRIQELNVQQQWAKDKEAEVLQKEMQELKKEVSHMNGKLRKEKERKRDEHTKKMKRLEQDVETLNHDVREKFRKEVEEENEGSLNLIWNGVKGVGKGIWKGVKSIWSKIF